MAETWLRTNVRLPISVAAAAFLVASISSMIALHWIRLGQGALATKVCWAVTVVAVGVGLLATWCARRPRLAYADRMLWVYLRPGPAIRLPVEIVECFLMGRAPGFLPPSTNASQETRTVVLRLRPQAEQWSQVDVEARLGSWRDSHIMIRGTWCEPITVELLHELNRRLAVAQRPAQSAKDSV